MSRNLDSTDIRHWRTTNEVDNEEANFVFHSASWKDPMYNRLDNGTEMREQLRQRPDSTWGIFDDIHDGFILEDHKMTTGKELGKLSPR